MGNVMVDLEMSLCVMGTWVWVCKREMSVSIPLLSPWLRGS